MLRSEVGLLRLPLTGASGLWLGCTPGACPLRCPAAGCAVPSRPASQGSGCCPLPAASQGPGRSPLPARLPRAGVLSLPGLPPKGRGVLTDGRLPVTRHMSLFSSQAELGAQVSDATCSELLFWGSPFLLWDWEAGPPPWLSHSGVAPTGLMSRVGASHRGAVHAHLALLPCQGLSLALPHPVPAP